jgi:choline dehydrogenase-like flavoprotein
MAHKHVNAVVVGAGAGGGIAAKELSEGGLSVVLLERGGWPHFHDHPHDELISQIWYAPIEPAFGPDDARNFRMIQEDDGSWRKVLPSDPSFSNVAACVGSGTASYGAMAWRFLETDFRMRSTYGTVEGSTLEDWPISYTDLEPFYEKAEWEIGVSGDDGRNPFAPPRRKPQPMPPQPYTLEARILEPAGVRMGLHPFPIPMLRNSVPYGGRPACIRCRYCVGFSCEVDAKCGTHNTMIPRALATGNCELKTNAIASEIIVDDHGRASGVRYYDAEGRPQEQTADIVVVSCAAIETARLLLNSRSRLFPDGAGNRHGWVGRNLQGHGYTEAWGLFERDTFDDVGPGACIAICDFNHGNPGLKSGGILANDFIRLPYFFSRVRPPDSAGWGRAHKDFQRDWFRRSITIKGPVQEMPVFDARVEVDPVEKDHWGIPVARLSGHRHPHDIEVARFLSSKAEEWLKEAGAVQTWTSLPGPDLSGGQHQAGTCRMGSDPKSSVTSPFGQVHDIQNLFIADGSLHVTNGGMNPVLTIMALAYRVSDFIVREWKAARFRA